GKYSEEIMQKTIEQLQTDLDREKAYTTKLNRQIDRLRDQLRNTISLSEHERILTSIYLTKQMCDEIDKKADREKHLPQRTNPPLSGKGTGGGRLQSGCGFYRKYHPAGVY
ncbi:MAG: hypothetical protein RRY35_08720, partial [Clostridiales bacterium]